MTPLISFHRNLLQDDYTAAVSPPSPPPSFSHTLFTSSLLLTIIILLAILCLMAFFTLYMRYFSSSSNYPDELPRTRPHSRKRAGVKLADVRRIPVVSYGGEMKIWNECSICLSEFEEGESVKVIPVCKHGFHPSCIDTWLSSHVSCPICRKTELFLAVDDQGKDEDRTVEGMHE